MCVCVCVCVCEREKERGGEGERLTQSTIMTLLFFASIAFAAKATLLK